jgi:hypothetical protein
MSTEFLFFIPTEADCSRGILARAVGEDEDAVRQNLANETRELRYAGCLVNPFLDGDVSILIGKEDAAGDHRAGFVEVLHDQPIPDDKARDLVLRHFDL